MEKSEMPPSTPRKRKRGDRADISGLSQKPPITSGKRKREDRDLAVEVTPMDGGRLLITGPEYLRMKRYKMMMEQHQNVSRPAPPEEIVLAMCLPHSVYHLESTPVDNRTCLRNNYNIYLHSVFDSLRQWLISKDEKKLPCVVKGSQITWLKSNGVIFNNYLIETYKFVFKVWSEHGSSFMLPAEKYFEMGETLFTRCKGRGLLRHLIAEIADKCLDKIGKSTVPDFVEIDPQIVFRIVSEYLEKESEYFAKPRPILCIRQKSGSPENILEDIRIRCIRDIGNPDNSPKPLVTDTPTHARRKFDGLSHKEATVHFYAPNLLELHAKGLANV
ncbi:hypothetical protein OROGR_002247 [Orobanche gracilis]